MIRVSILLFFVLMNQNSFASAVSSSASLENIVFDANSKAPLKVLRDLYDSSDLIFIGESNHAQITALEYLSQLLKQVGSDPKLKTIVLERYQDNDSFYRALAQIGFSEALELNPFVTPESRKESFCGNPQWAHSITHLLPQIKTVNGDRKDPVEVRTLDSVMSTHSLSWPADVNPSPDIVEMNCHLGLPFPIFVISGNREQQTAKLFEDRIWNHHRPGEKIIVLYHQGHLLQSLDACFPMMDDVDHWHTERTPFNWLSYFFKAHPEARARSKILILDELDLEHNPKGATLFAQRQAARNPEMSFGVELKAFKNIFQETGRDIFVSGSFLHTYQERTVRGTSVLSELADALIWTANATQKFKAGRAEAYLPEECGPVKKSN